MREYTGWADAELAVDTAEVVLNGVHAQEQDLGDLPVSVTCGGQFGHPLLGGGQVQGCGGPEANTGQLRHGPLRPQWSAEPVEDLPGFLERFAGGPFLLGPPPQLPLDEQGPAELERHGEALVVG